MVCWGFEPGPQDGMRRLNHGAMAFFTTFAFTTGLLGFMSNCLVIPVLCTKKMSNTFNRLLVMLAIFDNVYVMCSMLEAIRNHFLSTDQHLVRIIAFFRENYLENIFCIKQLLPCLFVSIYYVQNDSVLEKYLKK